VRAEEVDVHRRAGGHAAAVMCDLVHHDGGLGDAERRAAEFLGHGDAEPAAFGHRAMKFKREPPVFVTGVPVPIVELRYDGAHALANGFLILGMVEIQGEAPRFGPPSVHPMPPDRTH